MLTTTAQFSILQTLTTKNGSDYGKGTDGQFLRTSGTSTYWSSLATSDITSGVLTVARGGTNASSVTKYGVAIGNASANGYAFTAAGTDGYIFIGKGANTAPTWQEILPIGHGGTGTKTAPTKGGVIYASETTTYASTAAGTTGQVLRSNGTGTPTWEMSHAVNEFTWTSDITYEPTTNTFTNTRANNNWASQVYSKHGFSDGCYMSFRAVDKTHNIMVGLNSDPTANANWTSLDYAWYLKNDGNLVIKESNGNDISPGTGHTTYEATDDFRIEYSHGYIRYYHNGVCCRAVARAISGQLYFDSSFYNAGAICDIRFGAISNENSPEIYLTCATAAGTAAKTVTVAEDATLNGFQLIKGMTVNVKFNNINSVNNPTLEIAGTGAKAIYYRGIRVTYQGLTNTIVYCLLYDGSQWQITNEIPPAFGSCTTAVGTAAKAVTINGFIPYAGAHVFVRFTKRNTALTPTLNINSQGNKSMYNLGRNTGTWFYTFDDTSYYEFVYDGSAYRLINNIPSMYATLGRTAHAAVVNPDTGEETTPAVTQIHGVQLLTLGNATTSTTDSGLTGVLELYNAGTKSIQISAELNTAGTSRKWYLPNLDTNRYFVTHSAATALGSNTKPIKLDANGSVSECSTYAGGTCITLNEVSKAATTASFYAPTSITASRLIYSDSASTLASTTISSNGSYLANVSYLTINGDSQTDYRLKVDGSTNITGTLYLTNTTDAEATADNRPALLIGPYDGGHLEFDGNEIMAKASATTTSALYLNNNGGLVQIGSGGLSTSGVINASAYRVNGATSAGTNYITGSAGRIFFGGNFHIDSLDSNATYINYYTANNILLCAGSSQGSVGIGRSPSYKLDVNGTVRHSGRLYQTDWIQFSDNSGLYSPSSGSGTHFYPANDVTYGSYQMYGAKNGYRGITMGTSNNDLTIMSNGSDEGLYNASAGVWAFYYARGGRVSIHGTSNSGWLINLCQNTYCYGAFYSGDIRGNRIRLVDDWIGFYASANAGGTRYGYIETNADRMYFRKENGVSSYAFDFNGYIYTNSNIYATGTMYADGGINGHSIWANRASGERSVGADYGTSGTIYLYSNGSSKGMYSSTGYTTGQLLYIDGNGATWYGQNFRARAGNVSLVAANGHRASMQADRNFVIYDAGGGAVWSTGTNSSIKVKENIKSLDDYDLINFKKLHTISFNYKPEMKMMYNDKKYGLIAEEVLQLYPNLVRIPPEYSDEKFDIHKGMNQYHITLDYEGFIPLLIKMVQKQQDEIDELKQKLKCD